MEALIRNVLKIVQILEKLSRSFLKLFPIYKKLSTFLNVEIFPETLRLSLSILQKKKRVLLYVLRKNWSVSTKCKVASDSESCDRIKVSSEILTTFFHYIR